MTRFYVIGRGEFPFDMLRYDRCWPAETIDADKISPIVSVHRTVCLETNEKQITVKRWESFGWRVILDGKEPTPDDWPSGPSGAVHVGWLDYVFGETRVYA